ncbi:methyl-accepting chemotaxis protein [Halomonadaceae bacterium KBTZ08]
MIRSSIARQVLVAILVANVAVAVVAGAYLSYSLSVTESFSRLTSQDMRAATEAQSVLADFKTQVQEWKNVLLRGHDQSQRDKYWSDFKEREASIQESLDELLPLVSDAKARDLLQRFQKAHRRMGDSYREGYQSFVDSGFDHTEGDAAVQGIDREPARLINEATERIREVASGEATELATSARSTTLWAGSGLLIAVLLGTFITAFMINRQVIQPTRLIAGQLEKLGEGELGERASLERQDELGRLAEAARKLHDFLNEIQQVTRTNAADLTTIKDTIGSGARDVAERSEQARQRIDQMATAMNEMASTASEVAQHAANVSTRVDETTSETDHANRNIATSVESMNRLSEQVRSTSETVVALAENNKKVSNVMKVIREIADQTNLLALNAAIEAARAGDAGRGFSVVADEVRNLAGKTQEATGEIDEIVNSIASGSDEATEYMKASETVTEECVQQVTEVQRIISDINARMNEVRDETTQVATAAEEQTSTSEEINRNITEVTELAEAMNEASDANLKTIPELESMAASATNLANRIR